MLAILIVGLLLLAVLFGVTGALVGLIIVAAAGAGYLIAALLGDLADGREGPPR